MSTAETAEAPVEHADGYTKREQRHYREIQDTNRQVMKARTAWLSSKEETAGLKKTYEGLADGLQRLIAEGPDLQHRLPGMEGGEDDAWRETAVSVALEGLTDKQIEALASAGVSTMGELEDLRAGEGLTSVDGIGEKTAEKIEEQMLEWLAKHREEETGVSWSPVDEPEEEVTAEEAETVAEGSLVHWRTMG